MTCKTKGKKFSKETCDKISKANKGKPTHNIMYGQDNPAWKGGLSFEPYTSLFNQQLKDKVRTRDNFICQICNMPELECNQRLAIHHIDYNKKNCNMENLISLCCKCHMKTNINREYWIKYFENNMMQKQMRGGR